MTPSLHGTRVKPLQIYVHALRLQGHSVSRGEFVDVAYISRGFPRLIVDRCGSSVKTYDYQVDGAVPAGTACDSRGHLSPDAQCACMCEL